MIYRIHQIKLNIDDDPSILKTKSAQMLGISVNDIISFEINKRSIDARKKDQLCYVYAVDLEVARPLKKKFKDNEVSIINKNEFKVEKLDNCNKEVAIIGLGPAGLLAGYVLALAGIKPNIFERGKACAERQKDIDTFHETGLLNPNSNVCFGEGGAGTFSDGKLNTLIKDKEGYGRFVLKTFCQFGAKEDIMYDNKPHIGTDKLVEVVSGLRKKIEELGGQVYFESKFEDFASENNKIKTIKVSAGDVVTEYPVERVILATGHSARDTFEMLNKHNLDLEAKAYAIGVRVLHDQKLINKSQYGTYADKLPAAAYKITHQCENGRGVYSFCMCPGGYVVNASSEEKQLVINGMSYAGRDGNTANSAIVVTVNPEDYNNSGFGKDPLSGLRFQRHYEELAYNEAKGKIPAQKLKDFNNNIISTEIPEELAVKGAYAPGNINNCLPEYVCQSISEGMEAFDRKIKGFGAPETVLLGIETRTSSPIRVNRNQAYMANIEGLYPCGEGAGYAGGIMSAAIDGIKVARAIIEEIKNE